MVLLRDRHHESQVRLDEGALGVLAISCGAAQLALAGRRGLLARALERGEGLVAGLDRLGQPHLVVLGQERVLADVGQVQANEVFFVPLDTFLGHVAPDACWLGGGSRAKRGRQRTGYYDNDEVNPFHRANFLPFGGRETTHSVGTVTRGPEDFGRKQRRIRMGG